MGVNIRAMNSEAGSVDIDNYVIQEQLQKISEVLKYYNLKDIFNMDETGLLYRNIPTRTVSSRGKVPGVKMDKTRMTVALFVMQTDQQKLGSIILGNSAKPRCFKGKSGLVNVS
ncbi:hypothetical protein [Parasitella parasitica]|uniref:DDE-1 domain-containing protein n=1 Tax=Parasitella parasitica TaxID=35722 RepID=A0A0B7MVL8_9FUNG|nr:hypothetical protein [Parasitella parasitica]